MNSQVENELLVPGNAPLSGITRGSYYQVPADISWEQGEREVELLLHIQQGINWWLGDLL